ncbi:hypothetical protein D3C87_1696930 [compost metagenome]
MTSLWTPSSFQNRAVSVCSGSITTRNFSFDSEAETLPRFDRESSGLKPWQK